ncbi:Gfo/Idh/MocA family oxidoreductase [Halorussus salilacus]|uniref:Gfo/Idh/MocA family protein n=1 Tax=Halorussus salilacus TaxID=2953750 RepID=UPI0020A114BA|nr:Gfo/Idh/MocA family oxidoreductase [Halorussus salilacus]USZ67141.1 Gfo/Idh/MocA family oxidoreductase [Halorussus salilacus]
MGEDNARTDGDEAVRIGIVGAGNRGRNHALRYARIPGAEVVAVADVDEAKARNLADSHGAESYASHAEMLADADLGLDAVNLCVHAPLHAPIGVDALEAGTDVFCEKPMADSYAAARRLSEAAERTGQRLAVQNQLLYTVETRAAKAVADAGELGEVYHGVAGRSRGWAFDVENTEVAMGARRRGTPYVDGYGSPAFAREESAGGGAVYDLGSYTIGQILYLMGSPTVERVRGETFRTTPARARAAEDDEYRRRVEQSGYDVEDVGVGLVTFEDGSVLSVRASWSRYQEDESSAVVGTRGGVRLDPFEYYSTVGDVEMRASADLEEFRFRQQYLDGERGEMAYRSGLAADPLYHWVEGLAGRTDPLPTAELGLEAMLAMDGIYRSAGLGREVTREEVVEDADPTPE